MIDFTIIKYASKDKAYDPKDFLKWYFRGKGRRGYVCAHINSRDIYHDMDHIDNHILDIIWSSYDR